MASKKYKGKVCVYCGIAVSETADHIVCREFFPREFRAGLPKAPACLVCNRKKSDIEHYLTTVLPFGSDHPAALKGQIGVVRRRLERNETLRRTLADGTDRIQVNKASGYWSDMSALPFDGAMYIEYLELVVRGLVWQEWSTVVPSNYIVQVISMTAKKFANFEDNILSLGAKDRVTRSYAAGAFIYSGTSAPDDRALSTWRIDLYGGLVLGIPDTAGQNHQLVSAVMTGPTALKETIEWFVEYGRTT